MIWRNSDNIREKEEGKQEAGMEGGRERKWKRDEKRTSLEKRVMDRQRISFGSHL